MTTFEIVIFIKYLITTTIRIVKHEKEDDNGHTQLEFYNPTSTTCGNITIIKGTMSNVDIYRDLPIS
jgi:hypothetical protein